MVDPFEAWRMAIEYGRAQAMLRYPSTDPRYNIAARRLANEEFIRLISFSPRPASEVHQEMLREGGLKSDLQTENTRLKARIETLEAGIRALIKTLENN